MSYNKGGRPSLPDEIVTEIDRRIDEGYSDREIYNILNPSRDKQVVSLSSISKLRRSFQNR